MTCIYLEHAKQARNSDDHDMFNKIRKLVLSLRTPKMFQQVQEIAMSMCKDCHASEQAAILTYGPFSVRLEEILYGTSSNPVACAILRLLQGHLTHEDDYRLFKKQLDCGGRLEYEDLETESIRTAREAREQHNPSLVKLREVWRQQDDIEVD